MLSSTDEAPCRDTAWEGLGDGAMLGHPVEPEIPPEVLVRPRMSVLSVSPWRLARQPAVGWRGDVDPNPVSRGPVQAER